MALDCQWLGRVPYREAVKLQEEAVAARLSGGPDRLLLLEHPPVVTLGRSAKPENLRLSPAEYSERGIERVEAARGGDVTYHAPGQLVGYLIVDLAAGGTPDVGRHLRAIEAALCDALRTLGVPPATREGYTGVFVDDPAGPRPRKIASIGVGVRRWISWHGFALNTTLDLAGFDVIVPCGLSDIEMTSVARERGEAPTDDDEVRERVAESFSSRFGSEGR